MGLGRNSGLDGIKALTTQISMAPAAAWPSNTSMATGGSPTHGIFMTFGGNIVHGCQNRTQLQYSNMFLGTILGPDATLSQMSTSLILIAFTDWILPLSTAHELFCFFFCPISSLFGHHNDTYQVAPERSVASLTFRQLVLQPAIPSASLDCEDPAWPMGIFHPATSVAFLVSQNLKIAQFGTKLVFVLRQMWICHCN